MIDIATGTIMYRCVSLVNVRLSAAVYTAGSTGVCVEDFQPDLESQNVQHLDALVLHGLFQRDHDKWCAGVLDNYVLNSSVTNICSTSTFGSITVSLLCI